LSGQSQNLAFIGLEKMLFFNQKVKSKYVLVMAESGSEKEQNLIKALNAVAKEAKLHDPKFAYWECNNFSRAAHRAAKEMGVSSEVWSCELKYERGLGEIEAGEKVGHTF
jgi:hypothetical protein